MIARIRKSIDTKDKGFTLIELLVVMIIIGILAAIAIPLFLSQRKKAEDSAAKSDVSILGKELATWFVDSTATPVISTPGNTEYHLSTAAVAAVGGDTKIGNISNNVKFGGMTPATGIDATNYCVWVYNPKGDKAKSGYQYSAAGGLQAGSCGATVPSS